MDWVGFDVVADVSRLQVLLPVVLLIAFAFVVALAVRTQARRRRMFWCAIADRDVVIELSGDRVCSCSAFEEATAIACDRRCSDAAFRQQWPPALPILLRPLRPESVA